MINLQNSQDYEDSLNNILYKAPLEAGVERVVMTLLNDVLSDLDKWPKLSAEDTPNFGSNHKPWDPTIRSYYGLEHSGCPDGMILNNLVTYQDEDEGRSTGPLAPYALIETKRLAVCPINPESEKTDKDNMDQLDAYLDDLENISTLKYVIWTNGLCWEIFYRDDEGGLRYWTAKLDKDQLGYIKYDEDGVPIDAKGKPLQAIQIDPIKFKALIAKLTSFFRSL